MLVLTRKSGQQIRIGDSVVLTVVRVHGDKVRIGVDAPKEVAVHRQEVRDRIGVTTPPSTSPPQVY